jgi:SAM-dependent methyltransferase
MQLKTLQEHWNCFGETDPFWSILTNPERKGNRWDIDEFFHTGKEWVDNLMGEVHEVGLTPQGRCLDFGCGVGRLSQALCDHFESCDGIDIAPSMISLARQYNRRGERCRYHLNDASDLRMFSDGTFSFVLSMIVLQHVEPRYSHRYIAEFIRVLKPGGIAMFQIPSSYLGYKTRSTLPDSAYRARISLPIDKISVQPSQRFTLNVAVRNDSNVIWPKYPLDGNDFARLNVGNHWRGLFGSMLQLDDGRTHLPELRPHEGTVVPLTVTAPPKQGFHKLEVDIVEEGVTWFANRGLATPRVWVMSHRSLSPRQTRRRTSTPVATSTPSFSPVMEMHCIPRGEVLKIVSANGAKVVHDASDNFCGELYESYHYIVTRP